jgi:hypothetical protein
MLTQQDRKSPFDDGCDGNDIVSDAWQNVVIAGQERGGGIREGRERGAQRKAGVGRCWEGQKDPQG